MTTHDQPETDHETPIRRLVTNTLRETTKVNVFPIPLKNAVEASFREKLIGLAYPSLRDEETELKLDKAIATHLEGRSFPLTGHDTAATLKQITRALASEASILHNGSPEYAKARRSEEHRIRDIEELTSLAKSMSERDAAQHRTQKNLPLERVNKMIDDKAHEVDDRPVTVLDSAPKEWRERVEARAAAANVNEKF